MTYNFDPDKWYKREFDSIKARYESGAMTKTQYDEEIEKLEKKYSKMWDRLDGTYKISNQSSKI